MFVATFAISAWASSFAARAVWLVVIGPMAGLALGVRTLDRRQRFGLPLFVAALGWLWGLAILAPRHGAPTSSERSGSRSRSSS